MMPFSKLLLRLLHGVHLVARPVTLGVRGLILDNEGRVFLVRHTYVPGWYLPGGGVDPGETAEEALRREIAEEGDIEFLGRPDLVGVYFNRTASNRDHVLLYRIRDHRLRQAKTPDMEIAETGFFAVDDLPQATTPATRRRLEEMRSGALPDLYW